jgi:chromosome segregation ATPase
MTNEERITRLENSFVILTELARSADEWRDTHLDWINQLAEAQSNSDSKIAALANAQIRTDEHIAGLSSKMETLSSTMEILSSTMETLFTTTATLSTTMAALSTTMTTLSTTMANLAEKMSELADAQAHTDRRLDALIDIISQDRDRRENL